MLGREDEPNVAVAEELASARFAALNSHAVSDEAKALTNTLISTVIEHELSSGARKNKRSKMAGAFHSGSGKDVCFYQPTSPIIRLTSISHVCHACRGGCFKSPRAQILQR